MEPERADRISHTQINPTIPGSGADVDATQCSAKDSSTDRGAESDPARLGRVLQTSPRSNALPQTRRLDRAAHLVAPFLPVADPGWIQLPKAKLYAEFGLVNLISLIPSIGSHSRSRASS